MNERDEAICEAATRMFIRYGVKRTGMGDIAYEAGVARQTLYNAFPNKEAVLSATIRLFMERTLQRTEAELPSCDNLRDQLAIVFEHLVRQPYAMVHSSPNAEDIVEGVDADSRKVIRECMEEFRAVVETLLTPSEVNIRASGMTTRQLADAVLNFACAAKHEARDQAQLEEWLQSLVAMTLRCTV
ncbi:TetR/AcrR family transcriptional regulator [Komagataeibacter medellinensis]|uniref:TetR/AcrR family transcriptional regulator n=1 Tax=Komagataeibacter medellinensis TaxID=1177712 RepID=A0ABQ6VSG1_9PROT|nr:TetR/AcrR family transcriptional regulator [Komagataeibacter medellinensis]KAB8123127.1 TetR/AcrR family transcriptional regulator [Komagataeibacter medellinensis]